MGYSFVSASFFCIYAFHMALFCICSGLVARFNPRKLVTQQLWLYLVGQTLMLAFRAAVLRENFAETGGLLAAWLLPWRHIWYLYALIFWHLTLPVLCRLRDRLGLAGSCLGMALAVGLALCAQIAEAFGTQLTFASRVGEGTTVTILLQKEAEHEEAAQQQ